MHPDLKAWLHDPVQIAPYTGTDMYGKPTYGPVVTSLARIERHSQVKIRHRNFHELHKADRVVLNAMAIRVPKAQSF